MKKIRFAIFLMLFSSYIFSNNNIEYDDSILLKIPKKTAGRLYEALKVIDHVFHKNNILYWIDGGTLLGAVRHGGIIPWDKDADIEFLSDDVERVWKLRNEFKKYGFLLRVSNFGNNYTLFPLGDDHHIGVDILPAKYFPGRDVYQIIDKEGSIQFYFDWFYSKEINDIYRIQFGPIKLNCPGNPERYLHSYYSPCWMDTIKGYVNQVNYYKKFYSKTEQYKLPLNPMPKLLKCITFSPVEYERVDLRINLDDRPIKEKLFK